MADALTQVEAEVAGPTQTIDGRAGGSSAPGTAAAPPDDADAPASLLPYPTRPVDEARYLVADHAVARYRVIVRYFFRQHERSRYWLTADEIVEHVRSVYRSDYTLDECERDLGQLVRWGNLHAEQERSRASTVEEFIRRRLRYRLTPYTVELERLLVRLEHPQRQGGSLDPAYLEGLWERLRQLDRLLSTRERATGAITADRNPGQPALARPTGNGMGPIHVHPADRSLASDRPALPEDTADPRRVRALWREAVEYFTKTRDFANDYLSSLSAARPRDLQQFEAFLSYKDLLVQHLRRFVQSLITHAAQIEGLLRRWRQEGLHRQLAHLAGTADAEEPDPVTGRPRDLDACIRQRLEELVSLENWFCDRSGVDVLQRATVDAIEWIVRQTQRWIDYRRGGASLQRDLEELAIAFGRCRDVDEARRLAGLAFGSPGTRHIHGAEPRSVPVDRDVWRDAEPVPVELVPIARGRRERGRSEAVPDRRTEREAVLHRERLRQQEEAALWDAIFSGPVLDLSEVHLERPELRERLLAVLVRCMQSPDRATVASDGSRVELVGSVPGEAGRLVAPDGVLHLGRYRLRRLPPRRLPPPPPAEP